MPKHVFKVTKKDLADLAASQWSEGTRRCHNCSENGETTKMAHFFGVCPSCAVFSPPGASPTGYKIIRHSDGDSCMQCEANC